MTMDQAAIFLASSILAGLGFTGNLFSCIK